jgi:putative oxidoreductase
MRIASIFARYLLGLIFTVFGLNGFLNFIHQPPPANPLAIQFLITVSESHFAAFFFAIQLLGGLLLLSGYFVPLALTGLAAELYNILAFHLTLRRRAFLRLWWPLYCGYWSFFSTARASRESSARSLRRSHELRRSNRRDSYRLISNCQPSTMLCTR